MGTTVPLAVSHCRRGLRRRSRAADSRRSPRLSHTNQGRRQVGASVSRTRSRYFLLGARNVLHGHNRHCRELLRWLDRGPETSALHRAHSVVPPVRDEHAPCSRDLGSISGVLGPHVPQRTRRQQGDPRRPRPVGTRQAPVHDVATRSVVAARPNPPRPRIRVADGRNVRPTGSRPTRLLVDQSRSENSQRCRPHRQRRLPSGAVAIPVSPRARAGWDRADGRIPADAPLVHTPARNLPPLEQRDNPMHYSPRV